MKIGYSFWGFQADLRVKNGKLVSAPDGCATVNWCIVNELTRRGHTVFAMLPNRDAEMVYRYGRLAFKALARDDRYRSYESLIWVEDLKEWPELDLLFLEWRFPVNGRNTEFDEGKPGWQPDLLTQSAMLSHYCGKVPTVVWDLDYKYELEFDGWGVSFVLESGFSRGEKHHVDPPFDFSHIHERPVLISNGSIVYVGNRYERDWAFDKYLAKAGDNAVVNVYGNWLEGDRDSERRWPKINFYGRISFGQFRDAYAWAAVTPLLAKEKYAQNGFQVYRLLEAVMFGCIPVQMAEFSSPIQYIPSGLELVARDHKDLVEIANRAMDFKWRKMVVNAFREHLRFMDVRNFVDKLLGVAGLER